MAKAPTLPNITGQFASSGQLNQAFRDIEDAFENTLSRDGSTPNTMSGDLDLNGNSLLNVDTIDVDNLSIAGLTVTDLASVPEWRGTWAGATAYVQNDLVKINGNVYICRVPHVSGTFSTDLSALRWELFVERGAAGAGTGDMVGSNNLSDVTNAATALANLGGQPLDPFLTDIANLTDPNADRLLFWDDSVGDIGWLTTGAGLTTSGTDLTVTGNLSSLTGLTFSAGDILVATGPGNVSRLPIGTAAQQLRVNAGATAAEWFTPASSGLTFATAVAASGTSVDFTSIPSTARRITVSLFNLSHNAANATFSVQLGDSGGIETTGYAGSFVNIFASPTSSSISTGFQITVSGDGSTSASGNLTLIKTSASANTWVANGSFISNTVGSSLQTVCGLKTLSDVLTQVRVTTSSGSFDAGTIVVSWE